MNRRRKLSLNEFFDRVQAALRFDAEPPRRRISGDNGLLIWRCQGVKAGVIVSPSLDGAFVFLQRSRTPLHTDASAIKILKGIFAGEIIEVQAHGPRDNHIWMAWADDPAAHIHSFDRSRAVDVPVFTSFAFKSWPSAS